MASTQQRVVKLNTGQSMPIVGLGTFQVKSGDVKIAIDAAIDAGYRHFDTAHTYENEKFIGEAIQKKIDQGVVKREDLFITTKFFDVKIAIDAAIDAGYRHFDTAHTYENEKFIGEAIQKKIDQGVVKREDLFITTKLPAACMGKDAVKPCLLKSLKELNMKYVDLYLINMPFGLKNKGDGSLFPTTMNGKLLLQIYDLNETWRAMEKLVDEGLVKAIGVSNFSRYQLSSLLSMENIKYKPAVIQVEIHPYLPQERLVEYSTEQGVVVTAYCPLGSPKEGSNRPKIIEEAMIKGIAHKYKKTAAQVLLRWHIDRGVTVIPKSIHPERIKQNTEIFDFSLAVEDVDAITETLRQKKLRFFEFSW